MVVDEDQVAEAEQAATRAAAEHPCRLIIVVRRRPDAAEPRLDAEVLIGGRLGPGEAAVMRMYGRLALHAESVVLPLLAPDAPVVTWWFGEPPRLIAHDPLGVLADRRVTDCSLSADPSARCAPGRGLRPGRHRPGLDAHHAVAGAVRVGVRLGHQPRPLGRGRPARPATRRAALLAGWLRSRPGVEVAARGHGGPGHHRRAHRPRTAP